MINREQKIIMGCGVLVYAFNYLVTAYRKLKIEIAKWSLLNVTGQSLLTTIVVKITNPTFINLQIGNLTADVLLDNAVIGKITYPINRYIKAHGTSSFSVACEILYADTLQELWNIITSPTEPTLIERNIIVRGKCNVGNKAVNFERVLPLQELLKK